MQLKKKPSNCFEAISLMSKTLKIKTKNILGMSSSKKKEKKNYPLLFCLFLISFYMASKWNLWAS